MRYSDEVEPRISGEVPGIAFRLPAEIWPQAPLLEYGCNLNPGDMMAR